MLFYYLDEKLVVQLVSQQLDLSPTICGTQIASSLTRS